MYPAGPSAPLVAPGVPQKTLWLLKRNVYCERKLPQEQFAQLFAQYAESDIALSLADRDDRDPHRTLLDRCLVSLSSAVFVSERDKNALWEHMRVLAAEGVSPKLLAMLNTKDAVWSFREPPAPIASEQSPMLMNGMPGMLFDTFGSTAQKLDFSVLAHPIDSLGPLDMDPHGSFDVHMEPRF